MVDQTTGTLTVANITEGEYASEAGVNLYCVASRVIGKSSYTASVRSRTITVFYACKCCPQLILKTSVEKNCSLVERHALITYKLAMSGC